MLSDREREVLRGIERQFAEEDPDTLRQFGDQGSAPSHSRAGYLAGIGVCGLFTLLMLMAGSGIGAGAFCLVGLVLTGLLFARRDTEDEQ